MNLTEAKKVVWDKEAANHKDDWRIFYPDPCNENDCAVCGKSKEQHQPSVVDSKIFFCKTKEDRKGKPYEQLLDEAAELYAESKAKEISPNTMLAALKLLLETVKEKEEAQDKEVVVTPMLSKRFGRVSEKSYVIKLMRSIIEEKIKQFNCS